MRIKESREGVEVKLEHVIDGRLVQLTELVAVAFGEELLSLLLGAVCQHQSQQGIFHAAAPQVVCLLKVREPRRVLALGFQLLIEGKVEFPAAFKNFQIGFEAIHDAGTIAIEYCKSGGEIATPQLIVESMTPASKLIDITFQEVAFGRIQLLEVGVEQLLGQLIVEGQIAVVLPGQDIEYLDDGR